MKQAITRYIASSVYSNETLREKICSTAKDPYHAVVQSYGINEAEVIKHAFNAKINTRNFYLQLFVPALLFFGLLFFIYDVSHIDEVGAMLVFAFYALIFLVVFGHVRRNKKFIRTHFIEDYKEPFTYKHDNASVIENYKKKISDNAVFYSGYSPFVGSGLDIGGWSFVVDTDKGRKEWDTTLEPMDFSVAEIYEAIDKDLSSLNVNGLKLSDKVFINGKSIRNDRNLLPDILSHPVSTVTDEFLHLAMNNSLKDFRFYKVIQVEDWGGDLVLTSYLRLHKDEKSLFVENNYYLLPPIADNLKKIDRLQQVSPFKDWISDFGTCLFLAPIHSFISVFKVLGSIGQVFITSPESLLKKEVKQSPSFDYGAVTSIRESLAQLNYSAHFQKLDKERYFKIVEKRIFNLLEDFLSERNIDTSDFKERQTSILNHGVIVTGGNINSQNIAVGKSSTINSNSQKNRS